MDFSSRIPHLKRSTHFKVEKNFKRCMSPWNWVAIQISLIMYEIHKNGKFIRLTCLNCIIVYSTVAVLLGLHNEGVELGVFLDPF